MINIHRVAEQTMWNVRDHTCDSESIDGSNLNLGVRYLKSAVLVII